MASAENNPIQKTLPRREDKSEAENIKIVICPEPCDDTPASLLCSSSTINTEAAVVQRFEGMVVTKRQDIKEISDTSLVANKRNSCNLSQDKHQIVEYKPTWLANNFGRRLTTPFIKANIKSCHKKLANLQLTRRFYYQYQQPQQNFLNSGENPMDIRLLNSSSTVEIYNQDYEHKSLMKNIQTTSDSSYVDKCKKSPEKGATDLRQARRRKRLSSLLRRSTKSAPG